MSRQVTPDELRKLAVDLAEKLTEIPSYSSHSADSINLIREAADEIARLNEVVAIAQSLEDFSPTPNTYVGGQSTWSMTKHHKALALKKALIKLQKARNKP